jgi:hypothetical protein
MPSDLGFYVVFLYLLFWLFIGIMGFIMEFHQRISKHHKHT